MKKFLVATAIMVAGLANAATTTVSGFNEAYSIANWTLSPGSGLIDTAGAPVSINLTSGDDASAQPSYTTAFIRFVVDAQVNFSWTYGSNDGDPTYDPFGYVLADNPIGLVPDSFTQLSDDLGTTSQQGSASVFVSAGQYFGFSGYTVDNQFGAASTLVNGLRIVEIPEPSSLLLLAIALAGVAATRTGRGRAAA